MNGNNSALGWIGQLFKRKEKKPPPVTEKSADVLKAQPSWRARLQREFDKERWNALKKLLAPKTPTKNQPPNTPSSSPPSPQ